MIGYAREVTGTAPGGATHRTNGGRDFRLFWAGQTVSLVGSQVSALALPLTAALVLGAGPAEMGILGAAGFLPFLFLTLPAGAWIDRMRRRPILIAADLGRALLMAVIPIAAIAGWLRIELLYVVALGSGCCQVFFDLAYLAHVPSLVPREQLTVANGRLQATASAAEVGGPGIAGLLIQAVGAPLALLLDAASYLVSALSLGLIGAPEQPPAPPRASPSFRTEITEGLRFLRRQRVLRACAFEAAQYNLFNQVIVAVLILHATREIGLAPAIIGLAFAVGSVGSLAGAALAPRIAHVVGVGRAITGSMVVACAATLLLPLAASTPLPAVVLATSFAIGGFGVAISNVHIVTLRQAVTPDAMLGRLNASYRTLVYGAIPIGSLLGGLLGELIGLRGTLLVGALGVLVAPAWVIGSALPRMRHVPDHVDMEGAT
jgi:MFS family permease